MANQLDGSTYTNLVDIAKEYAAPQYADSTNNALIGDLMQTYLYQRGDRSFTREKAERQGRFEALLAVVAERLDESTIHQINASLYDECPDCGGSKPTASARCFTCTADKFAANLGA